MGRNDDIELQNTHCLCSAHHNRTITVGGQHIHHKFHRAHWSERWCVAVEHVGHKQSSHPPRTDSIDAIRRVVSNDRWSVYAAGNACARSRRIPEARNGFTFARATIESRHRGNSKGVGARGAAAYATNTSNESSRNGAAIEKY